MLHHLAREELSWKIFNSCFLGGSYSEDVNERITGLDEESPINKSAAGTNDKTGNISTKKRTRHLGADEKLLRPDLGPTTIEQKFILATASPPLSSGISHFPPKVGKYGIKYESTF